MTNSSKYNFSLFDLERWLSDLDTCEKVSLKTFMIVILEEVRSIMHLDCADSRLTRSKTKFGARFLTKDTMSEGR